jgi:hypothetical protein
MPITFAKPQLLEFEGNAVTDHNRGELAIDYERIETKQRMANGTMRKYVVADKRTFNVSWEDVPNDSNYTVDGHWGGDDIKGFYDSNAGAFTLTVTYDNGDEDNIEVMFSDFSYVVNKRGLYNFWNVDVTLEEV